jgi:CHAT domain-containing protein/predicted negative regulator of RcsB-dependent stress response
MATVFPAILLFLLVFTLPLFAQEDVTARELRPDVPLEGTLQYSYSDTYFLDLDAASSAEIQLEQGENDFALEVSPPEEEAFEVDARESGPEPLLIHAAKAGRYRVQVKLTDGSVARAHYELRLTAARAERQDDSMRGAAQLAATDARRLVRKGGQPNLREALGRNELALALWRKLGDRAAESAAMLQRGDIYYFLNEIDQAPSWYLNGLAAARESNSRWLEGEGLNNLAMAEWRAGSFTEAASHLNEARDIWKGLGHRYGEAAALSNLGILNGEIGSYAESARCYQDALPIVMRMGDKAHEAFVRSNLGVVQHALAEDRQALTSLNRAAELFRQSGNRAGEGRAMLHTGRILLAAGHRQQAAEFAQRALEAARDLKDTRSESDALNVLGDVEMAEGRTGPALESYDRALQLYDSLANRSGKADSLHRIGVAEGRVGNTDRATEHLKQALELRRALGIRDGEAETLFQLAKVEDVAGDLGSACEHIDAALNLTDSVRILASGPYARMTYLASKQEYFAFAIELYMERDPRNAYQGYSAHAFEIAERARSRALLDEIEYGLGPRVSSISDARLRRVTAELNFWSTRLSNLDQQSDSPDLPAVNRRIDELLDEFHDLESASSTADSSGLRSSPTMTVAAIQQQVLDPETVLMEFALGERQSILWLVTSESMSTYRLPGRKAVEQAATGFIESVNGSRAGPTARPPQDAGIRFSKMILGQAAHKMKGKRLLIVAEDVLLRTPFGALPDPVSLNPLIAEHEIVSVPSAVVLAEIRLRAKSRKPAPNDIAVVADPVLDAGDQRNRNPVRGTRVKFARLPNSRAEADNLLALRSEKNNLRAVDFDANRALFIAGRLNSYRIIHIGTHAVAQQSRPELAKLVLSSMDRDGKPRNGFLFAYEISRLNLRAELVTLAGCKTGLGTEIRGEGTVGLSHAFLQSGASSVLVSLWDVDDESSAELMRFFYDALLRRQMRPGAALRQAEMAMASQGRWTSADYAAWTLIGDWR